MKSGTAGTGGTTAIFVAKLVFMAAGYVLVAGLSRLFDKDTYGKYAVINGVLSLLNMVLINGSLQSVSRFVAEKPDRAGDVQARALRYQAALAGAVIAVYFGAAPLLGWFFRDASLVPIFRVSAIVCAAYALYAINVGVLNGKRSFYRQAALDVTFSTTKVTMMLVAAGLGFGLVGAFVGFGAAALSVLAISCVLVGVRLRPSAEPIGLTAPVFVRFAIGVMGVALLTNLFLQADLFMLKRLAPTDVANATAALYNAAQQIARLPYYIMVTAALVLFPSIAALGAVKTDDSPSIRARRADIVSQAFTGIAGLLAGMAALVAPIADRVVAILFPASYADAGPALAWLVVAGCLFTLASIAMTMISAAGRPQLAVGLLAIALVAQASISIALVPQRLAVGAAMASTCAAAGLVIAAGVILRRTCGLVVQKRVIVVLPLATAGAAALATAYNAWLPTGGRVLTLLFLAVAYGLYLLVLAVGGVLIGARADESRVLLVTKPLVAPFNDGAKVLARDLAQRLERAATVDVYAKKGPLARPALQNVRVFLWLLLARYHYTAVHFFFAPNKVASRAVRLLKLLSPGVPFVQTVMSRPQRFDEPGLIFGDIVVAHSQHSADAIAAATGREVGVIRPGIDLSLHPLEDRATALARVNFAADQFHLLFAGDIDEGGALPHLAAVVPPLLLKEPKLHFHFSVRTKTAATKALADAFFKEHFASHARATIHFDHDPFSDLLAAQDAMLLPAEDLYKKVDAPLVALESLARGKPVFVLERPPLDELVPESLRATLVAADDDALIENIRRVIATPIAPEELRRHVAERFDITNAAAAYRKIHERL